jgi:hypothetical protein
MKNQIIPFYTLILCLLLSIIDKMFDLHIKLFIALFVSLTGIYYTVTPLLRIYRMETKQYRVEIISEFIFLYTTAFTILILLVRTRLMFDLISVAAIINFVFAYYLIFKRKNKNMLIQHIAVACLIGLMIAFFR